MRNTISSIVDSSHNDPLSIIIVGIGDADFTMMEELDSDDKLLVDFKNRKAKRDIVQFVPFNKFSKNVSLLTQEVLAEFPDQLAS